MSNKPSGDVVTPEQFLEHYRRPDKKLVMVICDSPHIPTGQASYIRNLFGENWPNDDWDLVQYAWWHQWPQGISKWPIIPTLKRTEEPTLVAPEDKWGHLSLRGVLEQLQPDLVYTMGDPHMVEPILEAKKEMGFRMMWHVMVDGFPLTPAWKEVGVPDLVIPATKWAKSKLEMHFKANQIPLDKLSEPIGLPLNLQKFAPNEEIRRDMRKMVLSQAVPPVPEEQQDDAIILLTVARNQFRKGLQFGLEAFAAVRRGEYGVCKNCNYVTVPPIDYHMDGFLARSAKVVSEYCRGCGKNDQWAKGVPHPNLYYYWHVPMKDVTATSYDLRHMFKQMGLYNQEGKLDGIFLVQNRSSIEGVTEDDMVRTYLLSDIFLLPTLGEGFGVPVVEAMACGKPAIVTQGTNQQELVANETLCVPPERYLWEAQMNYPRTIPDVNEMTRTLLHLVENKEEREYLADYCLKRSGMWRKEVVGQMFKELIDSQLTMSTVRPWQVLSEGM